MFKLVQFGVSEFTFRQVQSDISVLNTLKHKRVLTKMILSGLTENNYTNYAAQNDLQPNKYLFTRRENVAGALRKPDGIQRLWNCSNGVTNAEVCGTDRPTGQARHTYLRKIFFLSFTIQQVIHPMKRVGTWKSDNVQFSKVGITEVIRQPSPQTV